MKKLLLKNYLYYFLLIFCIATSFQSCTKEEIIEVQVQQNNLNVESVSLSEVENNSTISALFLKNDSKIRIGKSSNALKESNNYEILTDEISKASYKDYEAFTFRIDNPNQPLFTFDNYVIRKNHDGSVEEFILRYEYDQRILVQNQIKSFASIKQYDTNYNLLSSTNQDSSNEKNSTGLNKTSQDCIVTLRVFHTIPDGREFEFVEGSVCQHPTECQVIIEYSITCNGGGGPAPGTGDPGEPNPDTNPDTGEPGSIPPDNGGTTEPITTLQPPLGQEGTTNTIEQLQSIIEEPTSIIASEGEINTKTSALIAYLYETNTPVFQDLNTILAYNLYDSSLNVSDKNVLWRKSKAIYNIVKNNHPSSYRSFDLFFSSLDVQEKESYTKNTMETALFSSVKSIANYWPQNDQEWGVLFNMMSPLLLEVGIEFLPFGSVFNDGKATLAGLSSGDYTTAVIGVVGLVMEFVPWAKVAKVASKVYDVGKSVFKMFKIAYNFMESMVTAIEHGLKTVLDGNVLRLFDNAGSRIARISDNVFEVSKHGIKAVDGSVVFRSADDVNVDILNLHPNWDPPYSNNITVTEFKTAQNEQFVRVFKQGTNNPEGEFIVKASEINGLTPLDIKNKLALDNIPDKIVDVNVPANFPLRTGEIAPRPNDTDGGLIQFQLLQNLDSSFFNNIRNL